MVPMVETLLMAFAVSTVWHYTLYFGVVIGIGVGLGSVIPIQSCLTSWFKRRRATAMAIAMSAAGISTLMSAPLLAKIIDFTGNWRVAWVVVAMTGLAAAIIVAFGVVDRPEYIDQCQDGVDPDIEGTDPGVTGHTTRIYQTSFNWSVGDAIKTRSWWLLVLGTFAFLALFYVSMGHGVVQLLDLGHSKELASFSIGLVVMCSIFGRLTGGFLCDRIEPRYIWSFALGMMFCGIFCLKNGSSPSMVYTYAATLGVGMGASYVCMIASIGNYFGADAYPRIAGLLFPIGTVLAAFSPILAGLAYDRLGSYDSAFQASMAIALLGALSMLFATPPQKNHADKIAF